MPNPVVIEPHGFCSGVMNAVRIARKILTEKPGEKIYCLHQLVHNEIVVDELSRLGMVTVESINEIPDGAHVLFSAHGVSPETRRLAAEKKLTVTDTTCPFVSRVHKEARNAAIAGKKVVIVGDERHAEVKGVAGEVSDVDGEYKVVRTVADVESLGWEDSAHLQVVVQTTLAEDDVKNVISLVKKIYPNTETSAASSVCTATHDRQKAVRDFIAEGRKENKITGVLVLGSPNSANTKRLAQIAEQDGGLSWRVGALEEIDSIDFTTVQKLGITAGASTPEKLLDDVVDRIKM